MNGDVNAARETQKEFIKGPEIKEIAEGVDKATLSIAKSSSAVDAIPVVSRLKSLVKFSVAIHRLPKKPKRNSPSKPLLSHKYAYWSRPFKEVQRQLVILKRSFCKDLA